MSRIIIGLIVLAIIWAFVTGNRRLKIGVGVALSVGLLVAFTMVGAGGFRRMVNVSGIYSVLRPDGYDVVCFVDSDGLDGGLFCVPCSQAKCGASE